MYRDARACGRVVLNMRRKEPLGLSSTQSQAAVCSSVSTSHAYSRKETYEEESRPSWPQDVQPSRVVQLRVELVEHGRQSPHLLLVPAVVDERRDI